MKAKTDENRTALSPRLAELREQIMERKGSWVTEANPFALDVALWRAAVQPGRSRVQVRAGFLYELVRVDKLDIFPGWALAGEHLSRVTQGFGFLRPANAPADPEALDALGLSAEEKAAVKRAVELWHGNKDLFLDGKEPHYVEIGELDNRNAVARGGWSNTESATAYWAGGWVENHSIRDYAKVLRLGFGGIRLEVEEQLARADITDPEFPQKENFWRAALSICDAGTLLGERYAELARELAVETKSPAEKKRLQKIAATCAHVPGSGARTFFEAVQALWLAHILTCGEDGINANSLGRLDQILFPYYEADRKAGRLTRDEALEIMEEFACKLYLEYDVQAITLGGANREGGNAVNELSYLFLEATRNVDFIRDLSVRLSRNSPPEFVASVAEHIARGGGIPFIFNDDCFIPALSERGITVEDARDYAPIGCIELTIPGRANPHAVSGWFNSLKCLELALFDGVDPRSGLRLGPATGDLATFKTFDQFYAAYQRQVEALAARMVYLINRGELAQRERGPLPCWSTLTDDCIPRGRDITNGGAVYNYHSICFLGTANTADSLLAVKKLLFEEKRVSATQLLDAIRSDFADAEPLRKMLLTKAHKYGNDCAEVDALASRICNEFIDLMDRMRSPLDGRYVVHLFSFLCNITFGKTVGATPDGRKAQEPLAYSLSAHQGRDQEGVTAMLNSLARLPHNRAAGATAAIIEIDPSFVAGEAGVQRLTQIIQGAVAMKIGQLQWNVTTVERLKQAQQDPEHYGNIPVRVAGYSQMFKLINRELQDHIIARTKHRE